MGRRSRAFPWAPTCFVTAADDASRLDPSTPTALAAGRTGAAGLTESRRVW